MPDEAIRILVVNNGCCPPKALAELLESSEFQATTVGECSQVGEDVVGKDINAAIILNMGQDAPRRADVAAQTVRMIERLSALHVGLLMMAPESDGLGDDGVGFLETIRPDATTDELRGRLSTMAHYRPVIQHLERELMNMQRLGKKLNRHFTEIDQEMRLASRLQRDFLPQELPTAGGIRVSTLFRPASWVSGDMYDVFRVDEQHVGMYVADAVGHGMAAGLLTMYIKRAVMPKKVLGDRYEIVRPGEVLAVLNDNLKAQNLPNCQFVTACYCLYDVSTRQLQAAGAGHPYPIRIGTDGSLTEIRTVGGLLGVFPTEEFETVSTTLSPGEKLLLYSDGIEMAFLESRVQQGGEPRYKREFRAVAHLAADELVSYLGSMIDQEEGSLNPHDDITLIVLETPG
jgi:sigma-B regulation protein RsbU (phosphoserine phosphatase)